MKDTRQKRYIICDSIYIKYLPTVTESRSLVAWGWGGITKGLEKSLEDDKDVHYFDGDGFTSIYMSKLIKLYI